MVDETDFRILTRLQKEPFASWEAIGRGVGLSGTAVRDRLGRLERDGVLPGFRGLPAAEAFGRHPRVFTFEAAADGDRLVEEAITIDPVVWATRHQNGCVSILTYAESPTAGPPAPLVDRAGCGPVDGIVLRAPARRGAAASLGPLDWRILDVLVDRPRLSVRALSEATGLSAKTVRKRRDDLVRDGLLTVMSLLQSARARGWLLFQIDVLLDDVRHPVSLPKCTRVATFEEPPGMTLCCHAGSLAEVTEMVESVRALPGVKDASLSLPMRRTFASERLRGWIRAERERWEKARKVA